MEAVTVYVVLKMTFFAGVENIRYFSYTYSEKDCVQSVTLVPIQVIRYSMLPSNGHYGGDTTNTSLA